MLTLAAIKENPEEIIRKLAKKHFDAREAIAKVLELDKVRRSSQMELDKSLSELKGLSAQVGKLMKEDRAAEAETVKAQVAEMKESNKKLEEAMTTAESEITDILLSVPNSPCDMVPEGRTAEDNVVERSGGVIPDLPADALPHWELARKYDLIDFELGVKITGAGFPVYKGKGARLQRALISFFLDSAREAGYLEVQPPYVVNAASGYGTGQLPDKEGQMYHCNEDDLYLIPTAEVPVTNLYRDVILDESQLPIRNTAYSACFRREAGSYRADERGMVRGHQFNKVEMFQYTLPEKSDEAFEELVTKAENLVKGLGFHFRTVKLAAGDCSASMARTYDIEISIPSMNGYKEVSSVSNARDYQARRGNMRVRRADRSIQFMHTLNGSGLATSRVLPALVEQNQLKDGSIVVPEVLRKYLGGIEVISK